MNWANLRAAAVALMLAATPAARAACTCASVGTPSIEPTTPGYGQPGVGYGGPLPGLRRPGDLIVTTDMRVAEMTRHLYPPTVSTLVCACSESLSDALSVKYVLSAIAPVGAPERASTCLENGTIAGVCDSLRSLGVFHCTMTWRSGMSGFASEAVVKLNVLEGIAARMTAGIGPPCTRDLWYDGFVDTVLLNAALT